MAAVTSSISTAVTFSSSAAMARASAPIPQPRSAMRVRPAAWNRPAWSAATRSLVACSRPDSVNSIRLANGPNLAAARARSFDWLSTAATRPGECPALRSSLTERSTSVVDSYGGSESSSRSPSADSSSTSSLVSIPSFSCLVSVPTPPRYFPNAGVERSRQWTAPGIPGRADSQLLHLEQPHAG